MKVRLATADDLIRGMELFDKFYQEGALQRFVLNRDKLMAFMAKHIAEKNAIVAVDDHDLVVGVLAISGRLHFFSDTPYMEDVWFYVDKDYRSERAHV